MEASLTGAGLLAGVTKRHFSFRGDSKQVSSRAENTTNDGEFYNSCYL